MTSLSERAYFNDVWHVFRRVLYFTLVVTQVNSTSCHSMACNSHAIVAVGSCLHVVIVGLVSSFRGFVLCVRCCKWVLFSFGVPSLMSLETLVKARQHAMCCAAVNTRAFMASAPGPVRYPCTYILVSIWYVVRNQAKSVTRCLVR